MSTVAPVSVVVTMFNGEAFIEECLSSVRAQTVTPAEVIVIDDGSTDSSCAAVNRSPLSVRLTRQANAGTAASRNAGVALATQPYVAFLDQDDLWLPEKVELQMRAMRADGKPDLVFGHVVEFSSVPAFARPEPRPGPIPSNVMVTRNALARVGPFMVDSSADFVDWYMRAREQGLRMLCLPDVLMRRRVHEHNRSRVEAHEVKRAYLRHIKESLDRRRKQPGPG